MKKILSVIFVLCSLWTAAVAESTPPPQTTIRFWHAMRGQRGAFLERLARRYEELHPGVKIDMRAVLDSSQRLGNDYSALYRAILESLAQGSPPEVSQLYENWVSQLIEVKALLPLDLELGGLVDDLAPPFKRLSKAPDGKIYSVPFNKSVWVLFCNREILSSCSLAPPKTWEDLRQASLVIAKKTGKPGLVFRPGVDVFSLHFLAHGGSFLDGQGAPSFSNPQGVKSLNYWVDLVHQDHSCLPTLKALEVFAQGNAGFLLDTTSKLGRLESENSLALTVVPLPRGTQVAPLMAGTNLGVFRLKDARRQQVALDFAQYLTSPDVLLAWCQDSGYIPVRQKALDSPEYRKFLVGHPNHGVGIENLGQLVSLPEVAGWESVRGLLDDAFYAALSRQSTAQEGLARASALAQELLVQLKGGSPSP